MRSDQPRFFMAVLDPEFFESLEKYPSGPEYVGTVHERAAADWTILPGGVWTYCRPPGYEIQPHGWKIHVSAVPVTARETLDRVVPILLEEGVAFKFAADPRIMRLLTSKNWPRTGAGKFITIYPQSEEVFLRLLERCDEATRGLEGPYILSDRRYRDSKVVFYRYGEHRSPSRVAATGQRVRTLAGPDGATAPDDRVPYFRLPPWVNDPFGEPPPPGNGGEVLLKDRYRVTGVLKYSNSGGIYKATDTATGEEVVIREARPYTTIRSDQADARHLLEKEARVLQKLGDTGYTPRFVDFFAEWENLFLVQERVEGESLWGYAINFVFGVPPKRPAERFRAIFDTIRKLAHGLTAIHARRVVLRDFTKTNVLFTRDDEPRFIDFELAYEMDRDDAPVSGFTIGYASPDQMQNRRPTPEEDYYAFGALILDILAFTASGLPLNRDGVLAALRVTLDDLSLPTELRDVVVGLLQQDQSLRWTPQRAVSLLEGARVPPPRDGGGAPAGVIPVRPRPEGVLCDEIRRTLNATVAYTLGKAAYDRDDRLWPASPEMFLTNPLSIEFGAAGTALMLHRTTGDVPAPVVEWIRGALEHHPAPPGLYMGLSGVALLFLELGRVSDAERILARSDQPDRIHELPGLFYGAAGWGLANLHFWSRTGEERYRTRALEVAEELRRTARTDARGACWEAGGQLPLGLGEGPAGVAAFLVYAHAASGDPRMLELAASCMEFEFASAQWLGNQVLWYPRADAPPSAPKSPHTRHGSSGVGSAAIRLYAATGEERFRTWAEHCVYPASERFTNKLWYDYGMSGCGEFVLDMYRFLGDENYLNNAYHLAGAILPHAISRPEGTAFAGAELLRISCDFGMGSAGIATFLHRLLHPAVPRLMFPDELLVGRAGIDGRVALPHPLEIRNEAAAARQALVAD